MYINLDDVVKQLEVAGLVLDKSLRFDSEIQRWRAEGEDHERRGWSRLREWTSKSGATYIVGDYGVWHGNDDGRVRVELPAKDDDKPALSKEDFAAMREAHKEAQRRIAQTRLAEAKTAARWASVVWSSCAPVTEHDYLTRKQIKPHGLRILGDSADILLTGIDESNIYRLKQAAGALVVPMHDEHGNVCGLQFIYPSGHPRRIKIERDKEFWPSGMGMGGTFGLIGHVRRDGVLLIAEGYATAASLHETTGQAVAYAFSANNLCKAGKLLRKHYAKLKILFCADDDYLTDGNPGVSAAAKASAEIEGSNWTKPDFTNADGIDQRNGKKLTDYNDLAALTGLPLVLANQINAKLDSLNWRDALATCAGSASEGSGEGRKAAVSIMTLDEAVGRFVPIDDGKGKCLFDLWRKDLVHRDQMSALMPAGSKGDDIKRHPVWIERGGYYLDQVGFDPEGDDPYIKLNTWRGWPIKPVKGKCDALLDLGRYLCSGEQAIAEELYQWMMSRLAWIFQNPGKKLPSAIIMHGPQGTGKSIFFNAIARLCGHGHPFRNYSVTLDQKALQDSFNAEWADILLVVAEEVVNSSEKWQLKNELKELVSGDRIRIRRVFTDAYFQKNLLTLIFLSNENQPLPLEVGDRRHAVIWTPQKLSYAYYAEVKDEIANGGLGALMHTLLNWDLSKFDPYQNPPMTDAKRDLIELSKASDDRFIDEWEGGETKYPLVPCGSGQIYSAYESWCKTNGERHPRRAPDFISKIGRRQGWSNSKHHRYDNTHYMGKTRPLATIMPPTAVAPPDKTQSQWLTDCFFEFQQALSGDQ